MTDTNHRGTPRAIKILAAIGLAFGAYQLVTALVRFYVDGRIEKNVGTRVVDFSVPDRSGRIWRASELHGKWAVLHFFRSQCEVCVAERTAVLDFEKSIDPAKVTLLGVLLDKVQGFPEEMTAKTLARLDYHHPVLVADQAFADAFHGAGWSHVTPVTYVIDPSGTIAHSLRGKQSLATLLATLPPDARAR